MGVFPHFFGGGPLKVLTNIALPGLPLAVQSLQAVAPLVKTGIQELHNVGSIQTTPKAAVPNDQIHPGVYPAYQPLGGSQPAPLYGSSPFAPSPYSYQPTPDTFSPWGGPSWDYSTPLAPSSTAPSVIYSVAPTQPQADRTWEDLTQVLPLFL